VRQFVFPKDAILSLDGNFVTDHGRSELSISFERLENKIRTQRGGLRIYHRADKKTLSASWDDLPENDEYTVDFGMGAKELESFYLNNTGAFPVSVTYDTGLVENLTMVFSDFDMGVKSRRNPVSFYTLSMTLEEV